jgi:hypothetical protein
MSREEHLAWAKSRALEYVEAGDTASAIMSMASDLRKHDELRDHPGIELGVLLLMGGHMRTPEQVRDHIVGFN